MIFKTLKKHLFLVVFILALTACGNDDEANFTPVPERDRAEQQIADKDSIEDYLKGHYYNSSLFETQTNLSIDDIVIYEMPVDENGDYLDTPPDPTNNTRLWDAVDLRTTTYEDADYEYYILRLNQGGGESPKFTDQVRVIYEGFLEDTGEVFDDVATPAGFSLQGIPGISGSGGVIRGWQLILPEFNTGSVVGTNNGVVEYNNYGMGMMFIPSGLGYFSQPIPDVPSYSNLIFKFELLELEVNDHDNDGVPSYLEDLNDNLDVLDDNSDEDGLPNYFDTDDDNDGVNTRDELSSMIYSEDNSMTPFATEAEAQAFFDNNAASNELFESIVFNSEDSTYTLNTLLIMDSDGNGTPDYLQESITINYNE